ncbi:ATP-binding cassette domain-containing protein, partial [Halomonas sp. BBD48]|nr:ATP-binding cassette domain-containing protein [Halomonas sp. BBD48]
MSLLEARHLEKRYGNQVVLERIDFRVDAGEFVTLVGASGCGKTTFLKLLLGTERITRGSLTLDGKPLPDEPGPDRGVVFQKYSVFPHLTVLGNVMMAEELARSKWLGKLFGTARRQARDAAVSRLQEVGLENALDKYPHELSGGMQQRLAI